MLVANTVLIQLPVQARHGHAYCYRLGYICPQRVPGCVLLWEVFGGSEMYQVCLERTQASRLRWHCTCADMNFRGEDQTHLCKHIQGAMRLGRLGRGKEVQ